MKFLCLFCLLLGPVRAQFIGPVDVIVPFTSGTIPISYSEADDIRTETFDEYDYTITRTSVDTKTISFDAWICTRISQPLHLNSGFSDDDIGLREGRTDCTLLPQKAAELLGPISSEILLFFNLDAAQHTEEYGTGKTPIDKPAVRSEPHLTLVPPLVPEDPAVIFYDGLGANLVKVDLKTSATLATVPIDPNYIVNVVGIRPTETGDENEVWAAIQGAAGPGVMIVDMGSQTVEATLTIPTLTVSDYPIGVVFTNDGSSAFYLVAHSKADSAGNLSELLVFDTTRRTVTSTLPLPFVPQQLLIAPDALTVYILGSNTITYYDVLSGTADLTATVPLSFFSPVGAMIHPDGTRLFYAGTGGLLQVLDLNSRKITGSFSYNAAQFGGPTGANMSQDGLTVAITDSLYNVYIMDTRSGLLVATYNTSFIPIVFPAPFGR